MRNQTSNISLNQSSHFSAEQGYTENEENVFRTTA